MLKKIVLLVALFLLMACAKKKKGVVTAPTFELGIIADCQYCDCKSTSSRFYKKSSERLRQAIGAFNQKDLDFTIHLGDFIDRDFGSFDTLIPIWEALKSKKYHVLGNHDFSVADSLKPHIFKKLNLDKRYYSWVQNKWRFIVLDGNDLSQHGALTPLKQEQTDSLYQLVKAKKLPNAQLWNGGLSKDQLVWIENELKLATKNNEQVGFYCHFPVLGEEDAHNLWNSQQLLKIISKYFCVKFYFNGHNHEGGYIKKNGVHYLTFKGMVDTKDSSSYATVSFSKDTIIINGFGREVSRKLKIK